jgi:hypothetical protein
MTDCLLGHYQPSYITLTQRLGDTESLKHFINKDRQLDNIQEVNLCTNL